MEVSSNHTNKERCVTPWYTIVPLSDQSRFSSVFHSLKLGKLLRDAGIRKSFGLTALAVFQLLFSLVYEGKNWFRLLESNRGSSLPGKDVVYRFLNHPGFAWRTFRAVKRKKGPPIALLPLECPYSAHLVTYLCYKHWQCLQILIFPDGR